MTVRAKVLAFLEDDQGYGAPSGYISTCVGVPAPTVRRELSALLKAGRIQARWGQGAKLYYVPRPGQDEVHG